MAQVKGNIDSKRRYSMEEQEALEFHKRGKPGKLEIQATKPMATQKDLSLAYSPGVAIPVEAIAQEPALAYEYTAKGNMVAVVSNGTAILGLGNLGALASKPVMEGKAVLFKRFADVDSIDLEIGTTDIEAFINSVRYLGPSFGGINLEDIKAPDCFIIEDRLRELMDIPVFHDDQHGTAIIALAGLLNALYLTKRDIKTTKLVCNGAGAAGLACISLVKALGMPAQNVILCDTKGVVYKGRQEGMNPWKEEHAIETDKRTLAEAMQGADVFLGVSVRGAVTKEMVKSMAPQPIIFAMANPDPEITPAEVSEIRDDAIIATGRSDYPNQINNVLCFPYIFRGALDVQAHTINEEMKIAAAQALAQIAREEVPDEVSAAYQGKKLRFGRDYIIPVPFDPRLISSVPVAVAKAAIETGVAGKPIDDFENYAHELKARRDPIAAAMRTLYSSVQNNPKRIVFAEGEEEQVIRAALSYVNQNLGQAILIGREDKIQEVAKHHGIEFEHEHIKIIDMHQCDCLEKYVEFLYCKMQREGWLKRDCYRMVKNDRNHFAACMVALGEADGMVTGVTRSYESSLKDVLHVIEPQKTEQLAGISLLLCRDRIVFVADTAVYEYPTATQLADIAEQAAKMAQHMGYKPRVAFLSFSSFGLHENDSSKRIREATAILDERGVTFEYDGEIAADVALNMQKMSSYPFIRLTDKANILLMPSYDSASIATKMLQELGGATLIGPILTGLTKPVQIVSLGAKDSTIVNMAVLAALHSI